MADRFDGRPTIGVLSSMYSGFYFGQVMAGLVSATRAAGGRLIAVQTFEAGTCAFDLPEPPRFRAPVAWDHVSAFVVLLNAVDQGYLRAVRRAGKPVVMISDTLDGFSCPVVLPDNRGGLEQAVDHLVEHGHTRIAFAGFPRTRDLRERYDAYQAALRSHGITPDPALFFDTGGNQESGGEVAGQAMIAAGLPSTAVITGTDLNAVGLMRVLQAAGYEIPRDQAVVGFDDMEQGVYLSPSVSSVHQQIDLVGETAVDLLLRQLRGEEVQDECLYIPTRFVPRESCGCPSTLALGGGRPGAPDVRDGDDLRAQLAQILGATTEPGTAGEEAAARGADAVSEVLQAAVDGTPGPEPGRLHKALAEVYERCPVSEGLVEIMRCVRRYARHLAATSLGPDDARGRERVEDALQEIILALSLTHTRARYSDTAYYEATFNSQHDVSMSLLRGSSHEEDPRALDWLRRTSARGAAVGLWVPDPSGEPGEKILDVVSSFRADEPDVPPATGPIAVEAFPPAELVELADIGADEMVYVAPMQVNSSDWGFLAAVGRVESRLVTGRSIMNQWAAMLTIALDHGAVLESLRRQEELLRRAALYDELTGLPNRTLFFDRLQYSIDRAKRRSDYHFGVFLLDLDGFKIVNDSLGHLAGDQLLVEVAGRVHSTLRANDVAARLGGDEFAVLLDDLADEQGAAAVAERLRSVLGQPCVIDGQDIVVTATIGVALSTARYEQPQDVIRDADIAMYSAKTREKGTHAVFDIAMRAQAVGRLRTEGDLRRAIDSSELELHYQPVVELRSGRVAAYEALLRWRHPNRGLVLPPEFLPVAEECGLMLPIGRWVLGEACRQLAEWRASHPMDGVHMSVNVSKRQFWHGHLLEDIESCLREHELEPRSFGIEITEAVVMHDVKLARRILNDLHSLGVHVHIDDFGTGYSSLEALHHMPIDALKIDRTFVTKLGSDERSDELARAIIAMGASLGLDLVAEGIETAGQQDRLRDLGCTYGQGFWIARPMPADDAIGLAPEGTIQG